MTNEKIKEILDRCNGRFGWVQIHMDTEENYLLMPLADLVELLEKQMQNCENCLHAGPLQISRNTVFCFEHSCAMSSDNCCRDWIQRLGERR